MTDKILEFGKRYGEKKDEPTGFQPTPPQNYAITYRVPDGTPATYRGRGVIKMNGPFLVLVDEDKENSVMSDATFMVMFEYLICIERVDVPTPA